LFSTAEESAGTISPLHFGNPDRHGCQAAIGPEIVGAEGHGDGHGPRRFHLPMELSVPGRGREVLGGTFNDDRSPEKTCGFEAIDDGTAPAGDLIQRFLNERIGFDPAHRHWEFEVRGVDRLPASLALTG